MSFFPNSSALGLWVFSSDQSASTPWAQLVPLGLLADQLGAGQSPAGAADRRCRMPGRVHGGTALYDTVLAAYQQVQRSFDPSKVNSVVLMTDGAERLPGRQDAERAAGRAAAAPTRPAGPGDHHRDRAGRRRSALSKISGATGGQYYQVRNAADISGVFLDAVAQRR